MLADSVTDRRRRLVVEVTDDSTPEHGGSHRCTLIRASSELGVHRRGTEPTQLAEDHPTPLQVITVQILYRTVASFSILLLLFVRFFTPRALMCHVFNVSKKFPA